MTRLAIREALENVSTTGFQNIQPVMYVAYAETMARLTFLPLSTGGRFNAGEDGYRSFLAV